MMADLEKHIQKLIDQLQSPKASVRYDSCEHLRAAPSLTPEAIVALQVALNDPDEEVRKSARGALNVHLPPPVNKSQDRGTIQGDATISNAVPQQSLYEYK
jgi:hypothetical protein